jgi:hypothetical protein
MDNPIKGDVTMRPTSRISPIFAKTAGLFALATTILLAGVVEAKRFSYASSVHRTVVDEALKNGTVPPSLALAVARIESNFRPLAKSSAGARGVMQIMPATARGEFGVEAHRLWDAQTNVRLGVAYLEHLYRRYGERWDLALSHYNGGSLKKRDGRFVAHGYTVGYVANAMEWWRRYQKDETMVALVNRMKSVQAGRVRFASTERLVSPRAEQRLASLARDFSLLEDPRTELNWRTYLKVADRWLKKPAGETRSYLRYPAGKDQAEGRSPWRGEQAKPAVRFSSDNQPKFGDARPYRFR